MFNKPSFKFKKDDVFVSNLRANPKYKIHFYLNRAKINSGLDPNSNRYSDVISLYEYNKPGFTVSASLTKDTKNPINFFNDSLTKTDWDALNEGDIYTTTYLDITSSLEKSYIIRESVFGGAESHASVTGGITYSSSLDKLNSMSNIYNFYNYKSSYHDFDKYIAYSRGLPESGSSTHPRPRPIHDYVSFIEIPSLYRGSRLNAGSLKLSFYYTGTLCAEAQDTYKNGVLYETTGAQVGQVIGTVLYPEGLIVITASYALNNKFDGYLNPQPGFYSNPGNVTLSSNFIDSPRWVHYLSYKSFITSSYDAITSSYTPSSSSYTIEFEGETITPTFTMMAHAGKNDLVWSNNPTFVKLTDPASSVLTYDKVYVASTGSKHYEENALLPIKNIVSSSFPNYSESFSPTTYISKIGIYDEEGDLIAVANLATPVKKTTKQDYTFKLKLDI